MSAFYRSPSPDKAQYSTAEKFYDLEQSQKRYQELLKENIWLKQQIQRNNRGLPEIQSHNYDYSMRDQSVLPHNGDIALWSMLERNKYLEGKIEKLRGQYQKQSRTISSIKSSDKWQNRFVCGGQGSNCYEEKYLQLLRIRSPFY